MDDVCRHVLDEVDGQTDAMLGILRQLVEIPSISGTDAENEAIAAVARIFADHGLDVDHWRIPLDEITTRPDFPGTEVDRHEAWGLVGRLTGRRSGTGDAPTLMFNGHVDVVPPGDLQQWATDPFEARLDGGRLFGRGSCDMKAGLVAALWAIEGIRRSGVQLHGDLLLAAVLGEEDGGLGTYSTLARGWTADACVISEPTGLDLVPANAGALTFRLVVPGKAAHASRRSEGVSSIEKFLPLFEALEHLEARRNRDPHPMTARWDIAYPLSIGTIHAGDWASSVPDVLIAEGRIGVAIDEPVEHARTELEHAVRAACDTDSWLRDHPATIEWWGGQFASGRLSDDSDLLDRVRRAHAAVGGNAQETWIAPFGSDLRLMTGIGGVPTLQYGPGDVALAHAADESVDLDEVATAARALAVLAVDVCGHG
jgi:acetylornithine deacetylase